MVLVRGQVQMVRVVNGGETTLAECFTSGRWILGTTKFVWSKAYLSHLMRIPVVSECLAFLRALTTSCSILNRSIFFCSCHRIFEGYASCLQVVNFLLNHFLRLVIDSLMEIVPEFIFFCFLNSLFDWFQFGIFVLRGN